jgi:uncharacterized protein YndB with AHSA1/START domain
MSKTIFKRDEKNATLTVERVFGAPRQRVWRAMTDAEILDQWWAPSPWKTETVTMNFRVGGFWHYAMNGPEGEQHYGRMDYLEIDPGARFKAKDVFCDAEGNPVESLPAQVFETSLYEEGDSTKAVTFIQYASLADLEKILEMGMQEGLTMAQDQLEALLGRTG